MSFHHESTGANNHVIHAFTYADQAAREAAAGFLESDVGKVALQSDTQAFYVLVDHDPATWVLLACVGTSGASGVFLAMHPDTGATIPITVTDGLITSIG